MSYVVMECHPGYVVLLDEEGRFLKAANLRYEVGQTVYDPVLMKEGPAKQRRTARWVCSGVAAIAACFLFLFGFGYYQDYIQPYSSIYLTINPEVQMDLNRHGDVVGLVGTNEDGEKLLEGYDGKGKDKVIVADELVDRAIAMGFLSEGGQVSISIDSPDDVLFQEYGTELRTEVEEHLAGRMTVTVEIVDHKKGRQEPPESALSAAPSRPAQTQPEPASEPAEPAVAPPASSEPQNTGGQDSINPAGTSSYSDTNDGPGNGGAANDPPPTGSTPAPADTDYGPGSDGVTDYSDGNTGNGQNSGGVSGNLPPTGSASIPADTDYGPGNDGATDYSDGDTDDGPDEEGGTNDGGTDYDGGNDRGDDDGDDDDDDDDDGEDSDD